MYLVKRKRKRSSPYVPKEHFNFTPIRDHKSRRDHNKTKFHGFAKKAFVFTPSVSIAFDDMLSTSRNGTLHASLSPLADLSDISTPLVNKRVALRDDQLSKCPISSFQLLYNRYMAAHDDN